jgi:hypothetical protein
LRTCWNGEWIGFRSTLTDPAKVDSRANSNSNSAVTLTMAMLLPCFMELRLGGGDLSFGGLRFAGRGFGRLRF